jgi:hypothetical protein
MNFVAVGKTSSIDEDGGWRLWSCTLQCLSDDSSKCPCQKHHFLRSLLIFASFVCSIFISNLHIKLKYTCIFSLYLYSKKLIFSLFLSINKELSLSLSLWANLHHGHVHQRGCLKNSQNGFLLVIKGPKFIDELDSYCHLFKGYHEAPISKDLPGNSLFLFNFFYDFDFSLLHHLES